MWRYIQGVTKPSQQDEEKASVDREIRLRKRTGNNNVYDDQTRAKVGKWAAENGNASAVTRFNIPESTVRNFKRRYTDGMVASSTPILSISNKTRGRPCKLGSLDAVVQRCVVIIN